MKNQTAKSLAAVLALVLGMACAQSAPAQTFKKVKVAGNASVSQVAAGGVSVWALANGSPYLFNGKSFVAEHGPALTQIAVGESPNADATSCDLRHRSVSGDFHVLKRLCHSGLGASHSQDKRENCS